MMAGATGCLTLRAAYSSTLSFRRRSTCKISPKSLANFRWRCHTKTSSHHCLQRTRMPDEEMFPQNLEPNSKEGYAQTSPAILVGQRRSREHQSHLAASVRQLLLQAIIAFQDVLINGCSSLAVVDGNQQTLLSFQPLILLLEQSNPALATVELIARKKPQALPTAGKHVVHLNAYYASHNVLY